MKKPFPWFWWAFIILLLVPTTAGRLILNITSGFLILLVLLPFLLTGAGWIGWKIIQSKMKTCPSCGSNFINDINSCPICGSKIYQEESKKRSEN